MSETIHDELLISLAGYVPQFVLSIACVHSKAKLAESAARKHGAAYTPYARGVALSKSALYDCVLIGENAEGILGDEGYLADILSHLSTCGLVFALLPSGFPTAMSIDLERSLERARLIIARAIPLHDDWAGFVFVRETYDALRHAGQLASAGMPGRAAAVLDWLEWCNPLQENQRAAIALEKLRYYRQAAEFAGPSPSHGLLFHAQKAFHLAVHEWPKGAGAYLDQAAIWRRYGNDDYAARMLRSLHHASPDAPVLEALSQCRPETTRQPPVETSPEWSGTKRAPRVLVLTHDFSDYGMDTLYDGLCQVLGVENVVEYPWKPALHGQDKEAAVNYPCWFDYPGEPRTVDELAGELRDGLFDLIVFADFVQQNKQDAVLRMLEAGPQVPVVVYDPWDDGRATQDSAREYLGGRAIAAYFKREMLACLDYGPNAYPLPFGYPDRHVPRTASEHRPADLFWAGKRLFGTRSLYLDHLNAMLGRSLDQKLTQEEYRRAISEARVGL